MNLLQQLDAIFTVQVGLLFTVVMICLLCAYSIWIDYTENQAAVRRMLEEAHALNDDFDFERALRDEADAHYAGTVVNVVGYCLCKTEMGSFKPFKFTTVKSSAEDTKFLDMIACSHCPVCNPEMDKMLAD